MTLQLPAFLPLSPTKVGAHRAGRRALAGGAPRWIHQTRLSPGRTGWGVVIALAVGAPALGQTPTRPTAARPAPVAAQAASPADYRTPDPQNVLVIDTTKGRILVEMSPEAAPAHVERIKLLTREKFYDGLNFHRVIDAFMAQTGDPLGTGEGQSTYPDVKGEFTFRRDAATPFAPAAQLAGQTLGFSRSLPVATQPDDLMVMTADKKVAAWGLYCPGVAGMARGEDNDSANSQFFLMRQPYPSLEKRYTAWGRVIHGLPVVRAIKTGEPVVDPDKMIRVRLLADIPAAERPTVRVMDTTGPAFRALVERTRAARGADFSPCDIEIPAQVTGGR
ncbi:MAG: peptidylprolyl isomerase [Proteobacteria bacterium]|nr:peptidylprolyl isomerase [Pseudomonadota bacterium]